TASKNGRVPQDKWSKRLMGCQVIFQPLQTGLEEVFALLLLIEPERIDEIHGVVVDVRVEVHVAASDADRILADEPGQSGMVVPRPRVTPTASLAGISTPTLMRGAAASASSSGARGRARSRRVRGRRAHHEDGRRRRGWGERALSPG